MEEIEMIKSSAKNVMLAAMAAVIISAFVGVMPRLNAERANKTVAFAIEYLDLTTLSLQSGIAPENIWGQINSLGVMGISVAEYTGEELSLLNPMPLKYGPAGQLMPGAKGLLSDRAVILIESDSPYSKPLSHYLALKMPSTEIREKGDQTVFILPGNASDFKTSAFVPDLFALDFCHAHGIPVLFRPGPCPASMPADTAAAFDQLTSDYVNIKNVTASGMIMAGYPELSYLSSVMKEKGITFSQTEFVKQVGAGGFAKAMFPMVLPLHSLTRDEVISRNFSSAQIAERFVRAVHERSIRLIMVRPYDLYMGDRLRRFEESLTLMKDSVVARGYGFGWPEHLKTWPSSPAGALACGLTLVFCCWYFLIRLLAREEENVGLLSLSLLLIAAFLLSAMIWKIPAFARICGGLCGAAVAAEGSLSALDEHRRPWLGALKGLFIVIAGGTAIAAFYGTTAASLRLTPFSGVKLTLLLPPLLVLIHDLSRRVHPESLPEIINRPPMWGELLLIGLLMLALLIMALRSDNVSNVPGWEIAFREFMERTLLVRPRTKEFLIGYPALVLYWYIAAKGLASNYREALRIIAVLAFSSAVNTFCHFHTLLSLSVIRTINGWWLGLIIGAVIVAIIDRILFPLYKKYCGANRC